MTYNVKQSIYRKFETLENDLKLIKSHFEKGNNGKAIEQVVASISTLGYLIADLSLPQQNDTKESDILYRAQTIPYVQIGMIINPCVTRVPEHNLIISRIVGDEVICENLKNEKYTFGIDELKNAFLNQDFDPTKRYTGHWRRNRYYDRSETEDDC
jgi:hypothetical protein